MFVGRENELKHLNEEYSSDEFKMSIIYGRRRVGKTTLIKEFVKNKEYIYFLATNSSEQVNLRILSELIGNYFEIDGLNFVDFDSAFKFISSQALNKKVVFIIDEYPYLAESVLGISSILQRAIDEYFKNSKVYIILCGSSMSFMEKQVLNSKSPLYGRRTSQLKINPFNFQETLLMLKGVNYEDIAIYYGISGGVAEYLKYIDKEKSLDENLINLFFDKMGRLYEEPTNLLNQELRELKMYNDIIYAIANGKTKNNEIATYVSKTSSEINPYITNLIDLRIVEKKKSIGSYGSKKPIYVLKDSMYRFWYRFVRDGLSYIEMFEGEIYYKNMVKPYINEFMGHIFEEIVLEFMSNMNFKNKLDDFIIEAGSFWGTNPFIKKEVELDYFAIGKKFLHIGEAKWKNEKIKEDTYINLNEKVSYIPGSKKLYIFSKSGFTKNQVFNKDNVNTYSLNDMVKELLISNN